MLQESSRPVTAHKLEMQNRNHVDLTGITEVVSFDNKEIELETIEGAVRFAGEDLHVKRLTLEKGEVELEEGFVRLSIMSRERKRRQGVFLAVCLADGNDTGAAYVCCRLLCGGCFLNVFV